MASGPFEGPECRAFECLFPRSRSSFAVRAVLAQPSRTAVYGPVRTVVWQGAVGDRRPYADQELFMLVRSGAAGTLPHFDRNPNSEQGCLFRLSASGAPRCRIIPEH